MSNRPRVIVLLLLALLVAGFAVTWVSPPSSTQAKVSPPASWFAHGLTFRAAVSVNDNTQVDFVRLNSLKQRILAIYGSAAAIVILVGLAFGAGRRAPRGEG